MKRQRGKQWLALLLGVGLTLSLAGCLGGGGSGGDGGTVSTVKTDPTTGEATVGNNTYVLVDAAGETQKGVELTIDSKTGIAEVISADYTYNAVQTNTKGKTVIFTQKVDTKKKPYDGDLDQDCPAFSEAIGLSIDGGTPPVVGKVAASDGLFKPTPKELKSSNGKAEAVVSDMHLGKDITVAVTPYQAENFVPMKDHIASQIGMAQATVLAGADINIADSQGHPTTAEAACLSGKMILKASNQLTLWNESEINAAIDAKTLKLVVFKDKKWQVVNATIAVEGAGITIKNAAVLLRLYPFVFVKVTAAGNTFAVKGVVKVSGYPEGSALAATATETPLAGATVQASLPHVLNTLTVDNSTGLVTIGKVGWSGPLSYQYAWQLFQITEGTTDFATDLLANLTPSAAGSTSNGAASLTVDDQVKNKMTVDGQYLLQVSACGASQPQGLYLTTVSSPDCEQQSGLIVKKGTVYTVQMNPTAETALSTTSGSDGAYSLPGLLAAYKTSYAITPSKDGYLGWAQAIYSGDDISSGTLTKDLWMQKVVVTTTTTTTSATTTTTTTGSTTTTTIVANASLLAGPYRVVNTGNAPSIGNWSLANEVTFDGLGGWTGASVVLANPYQPSAQGSYTVEPGGFGYFSLTPSSTLPPANGFLSLTDKTGVAGLLSIPNQSNALFMVQMGIGYSQSKLNGNWFFVSYNPLSSYGGHDRITFDGTTPAFTSPSGNYVPASGTATLSSAGAFQLAAMDNGNQIGTHDCWLNYDGGTALCVQTGVSTQPMTVVGVRLGDNATYSLSAMAGVFHLAGVVTSGTGTTATTQTRQGTITIDGLGHWNGSIQSTGGPTPVTVSIGGTYTYDGPASPGRYTLVDSLSTPATPVTLLCGVSADLGTTVCHYDSGQGLVGIYMGVRGEQPVP